MKTLNAKSKEDLEKTDANLQEFKLDYIQKEAEFQQSLKKNSDEAAILAKQIEGMKMSFIGNEGRLRVEIGGIGRDLREIAENVDLVGKRVEKLENSNNPAATRRKRSSMRTDHIFPNSENTSLTVPDTESDISHYLMLETELKSHKLQTLAELKSIKSDLTSIFEAKMRPLEEKLLKSQQHYENMVLELKDKLSWLPMKLDELNGMSPCDARLFTIEARLRAEENSRILALNTIEKSLETIRKTSASPLIFKSPERRSTPNRNCSVDLFNHKSEVDRKTPKPTIMEGVSYDSFEQKRYRSNLRVNRSIDLNKELVSNSGRNITTRKLFKK